MDPLWQAAAQFLAFTLEVMAPKNMNEERPIQLDISLIVNVFINVKILHFCHFKEPVMAPSPLVK